MSLRELEFGFLEHLVFILWTRQRVLLYASTTLLPASYVLVATNETGMLPVGVTGVVVKAVYGNVVYKNP